MSARTKLNVAYANGSVLVAGLAGALAGSWAAFAAALAVLLTLNLLGGDIRLRRRR